MKQRTGTYNSADMPPNDQSPIPPSEVKTAEEWKAPEEILGKYLKRENLTNEQLLNIFVAMTEYAVQYAQSKSQPLEDRIKELEASEDELCKKIEKEQAETVGVHNWAEERIKELEAQLAIKVSYY